VRSGAPAALAVAQEEAAAKAEPALVRGAVEFVPARPRRQWMPGIDKEMQDSERQCRTA
jgi:hypothetical protein